MDQDAVKLPNPMNVGHLMKGSSSGQSQEHLAIAMNSGSTKVTVLMAVYNGEKYLRQSIDSVLGQTFVDFEFIIVDDCSTDSTPGIPAECANFHQPARVCK